MEEVTNREPMKRILSAALDVVNKETISGTRMHLIAQKAEMVQSNVHYYYRTKNELMLALQKHIFEECYEIRKEEESRSQDNLESQLDIFINQKKRLILEQNPYDFAEMDFWVQCKINEDIHENFISNYDTWRKEIRDVLEKYCPNLDKKSLELLPFLMVSILEGATIQYFINKKNLDLDEYFIFAKQMMLNHIYSADKR